MSIPAESASTDQNVVPRSIGARITYMHVLVVVSSLAMTLGAWHFAKKQVDQHIEARFLTERNRTIGLIRDRLAKYEDALWSGVATLNAQGGEMSLEEWRIFASTLQIDERYPGVNGIGVIHLVEPDQRQAYLTERTRERPGFGIHPDHSESVSMPITFIEPEDANFEAVGLDVAHESNRRIAALASRDTGKAQISGPITLVQDAGHTPGFLFYAPFYQGALPTTVADRQAQFIGTVYAPFVTKKLIAGLLAKELRHVRFSITDDGQSIYDEHKTDDALHDPDPLFSDAVVVSLYGREWVLDIRSDMAFRQNNSQTQPTLILIGGLLIEALIITLMVMMSRANHQAVTYASKVTADLKLETEKLSRSNAELEQFAYVASHDLKTPIRGIGVLTDIIKEDLHDYLNSKDANPDVALNLDFIEDRVKRMNNLISGVMEFSRIGGEAPLQEVLDLQEVIEAMASDFGLQQHQIELFGTVETLTTDSQTFRRVLENLVGNAIKYHDDPDSLRIAISIKEETDSYHVSVKDNGPGIDPRYHQKIFDVFQTLRRGEERESTGIGLAIVKKAVESHGCTIKLESSLGSGSNFSFRWPGRPGNQSHPPMEGTA